MTRLVTFGETALRLSPHNRERLETARDLEVHADGTASTVAMTAERCGLNAVWLSKLPDTALGRRVVAQLQEHDLTTNVAWADASEGRQGLAFHETPAEPRESLTIQDRDRVAAASVKPSELSMGLVQGAEAVFAAGSTAAVSETARETVEAILRAADGVTVFDLDHRPGLWSGGEAAAGLEGILEETDVLIASEDDARDVLDQVGKPRDMVHSIAAERDFKIVVVTRAEHGAIAWHDSVIHEQSAFDTDAVDSAGQHGAFVGGFLTKLLAEEPIETGLAYGAATAALARTVPGTLPTIDETEVEGLLARTDGESRRR